MARLAFFGRQEFTDIQADNHYLTTLSEMEKRPGSKLGLDRATVFKKQDKWLVRTYAGESLILEGNIPSGAGNYALKSVFLSNHRLLVESWHAHDGARDTGSILGLLLILGWFAIAIFDYSRKCQQRTGTFGT